MSFVFHIPTGELTLPDPPEGHTWRVKNVINTGEKETTYSILLNLLDPQQVPVATVYQTWDRKIEQYSDFALSVVGLAAVELGAYMAFSSINWERDNPKMRPATKHGRNTKTIQWTTETPKKPKELND